VKRLDPARVRLDLGDLAGAEAAKARDLVLTPPALQFLEARQLLRPGSDDQLAAALCGDPPLGTVGVELSRAFDAQARLERARHVVDPGVDDARGAPGLVGSEL